MSGPEWCTIESDPGVFTALIESFGVKNVEVAELWSLDAESLSSLGHVYGLIFLFKWVGTETKEESSTNDDEVMIPPSTLFFARQVTQNACATQAILSILLNATNTADDNDQENGGMLSLGPMLSNFKTFTSNFPPELRGEAIGASEEIRAAHNSFARQDSFLSDHKARVATPDDDVFHFVAYVPYSGHVYELDGLKAGPLSVGEYGEETSSSSTDPTNWLDVARRVLEERMESAGAENIKFNLMALVQDPRIALQRQLQSTPAPSADEADDLRQRLVHEAEKRETWKIENTRRKHNYIPFCVELLKALAKKEKLAELTARAEERKRATVKAKAAATSSS